LPMWGWFGLGNVVLFQPWDLDNIKVFTHWYLWLCVWGAIGIKLLVEKNRWWLLGVIPAIGLANLVGLVEVAGIYNVDAHRMQMYTSRQVEMAKWVREQTSPKAVFVTADNHNHWLVNLSGRKIVAGFPGWLWTYNVDYHQRTVEIEELYKGEAELEDLTEKYGVSNILVGPEERAKYEEINLERYVGDIVSIYNDGEYEIYQVGLGTNWLGVE